MATEVSMVFAYRDFGDPHRRASYAYTQGWYSSTGYELVVDTGEAGRAASINAAVRRAAGRVIVQVDPDSLVNLACLAAAVAEADDADGLVVPHDRYCYLSQEATAAVLNGDLLPGDVPDRDCDETGPNGVGNVTVFSRRTWELAGGFDERFRGWGGDDAAFAYACEALVSPTRRVAGDMWHLWHPRPAASRPGHPGYLEQMTILGQYRDAAAVGPDAVRALVAGR